MYPVSAYEAPSTDRLAVGLGWFSVALGVAELAAPRSIARFIGAPPDSDTVSLVRAFGARELGNGLAILAEPNRPAWMWSRVGGDALDLTFLLAAGNSPSSNRARTACATAAVLGVTVLDVMCAQQLSEQQRAQRVFGRTVRSLAVTEAITINRSIDDVEEFWQRTPQLPESLQVCTFEFRPAPGARGTELRVHAEYTPTGGKIGDALARLFAKDPGSQIRSDLRHVKQLIETGEVALSEGPSLRRPAQPAADPGELRKLAGVWS